jgi:uncharacterized membrane protein
VLDIPVITVVRSPTNGARRERRASEVAAMPKVEGGIVIRRPVDEVFTYATSAESHLRWVPGIRDAAYLDDGPPQVGSRWRATVTFAGLTVDTVNEVTRLEENTAFEWCSIGGPVRSHGSYRFTPLGGQITRFTFQLHTDDRLTAVVGFGMPVAMRLLRRELSSRLERVKVSLEAGEVSLA